MIKVEWNSDGLNKAMKDYARQFSVESHDMIKDLASKAGYEFARTTQPYGLGLKQKRQGENAVERDIGKVYQDVGRTANELKRKHPKHAKVYLLFINSGDTAKADQYADKHLSNVVRSSFDGGALLQRQRHKGRVAKQGYKRSATSNRSKVKRYTRRKQKAVGLAKASWIQSIENLSLKGKRVPKWLKNAPVKVGSNKVKKRGWGSSVTLISSIPYMRNVLRASRINSIIKRVGRNHTKYLNKLTLK